MDLPDDILLLVCRRIYAMGIDARDKIRRICTIGLVSRQMRQIERKFWRTTVNEKQLSKKARPIKYPSTSR